MLSLLQLRKGSAGETTRPVSATHLTEANFNRQFRRQNNRLPGGGWVVVPSNEKHAHAKSNDVLRRGPRVAFDGSRSGVCR